MMKKLLYTVLAVAAALLVADIAAGCYMLDQALAPRDNRADVDSCYESLFERYPDMRQWVDSVRAAGALRDTFVIMPTGERHHALYIANAGRRTAVVLHGWRNEGIAWYAAAR